MSAKADQPLREAMERLFTGQPTRTDGKLSKNNLRRAAGVNRALADAVLLARSWQRKAIDGTN
ncbi:hypothetical protein ABZ599_39635 [Streptomyces misionensis]|uniref:hypothetical protein n=1 Tax=Streptomyces misionensis TaxID=67331 RepID=UPI00340C7631